MPSRATARLQIVAAAALFSTGGVAVKSVSIGGWQVAGLRSGVAALTLALLLRPPVRAWSRRSFVVGAAYASTMILYVLANKLTTAANTIFLQSAFPLYVLLLGPWLLKEPTRRSDLVFMTILALGLVSSFAGVQAPLATAPNPMLGNLLATLSGVFWALTIVGLRWIGRAEPGRIGAAVVTGNALAFLACLPMAAPFLHVGLRDGAIVGFLGVFQIGVAYVFLTRGVREVSALEASVLLLIEPALNPIWAWWIQHETPGRWSLLGGVLIVGTTVLRTWWGLPRGARARSGSAV